MASLPRPILSRFKLSYKRLLLLSRLEASIFLADKNVADSFRAEASLPALKDDSIIKEAVRQIIGNGRLTIRTLFKGFSGGLLER